MDTLGQLAQFEVANSALAFRGRAYGDEDRLELLRDLLGLANAPVQGPRYIVLGVDDTIGSDRELIGISDAAHAEVHGLCTHVVNNFFDPPLPVRIEEAMIGGRKIVAIVLPDCSGQPYLLKTNASGSMRQGAGWIREGTRYRRLVRADFQRIFEAQLLSQDTCPDVRVGFAGKDLETMLHLPVMPLEQLPSKVASGKIRRMLEAKQATKQAPGEDISRIQRLVHAQVFGPNEVYRPNSTTTLVEKLDSTADDFEAADRYYTYEDRAHKLNLVLQNLGEGVFEGGTLVLDLPRVDGLEIAERIWPSPDGSQPVPDGYPALDIGPEMISVQTSVGPIQPGGKAMALRQPLRLCLRESASGKTIPVAYSVHSKSLRAPLSGRLQIQVIDDEPSAQSSMAGGV
ncbi:MAG: hypothetical protein HKN84_12540 [Gammaproteobacteria bacterium]|nr:hypothetical protein [Gammaproteobacteria bacterium]